MQVHQVMSQHTSSHAALLISIYTHVNIGAFANQILEHGSLSIIRGIVGQVPAVHSRIYGVLRKLLRIKN